MSDADVITLRVPKTAYPGLGHVAEHADALHALKEIARVGVSTPTIARTFATRAGISVEVAGEILGQLAGLHGSREALDATPEQMFDALTASIERDATPEWQATYLRLWRAARAQVIDALAPDHPLGLVNKTTNLTFPHQNLLRSARILTDARPVFDEAGDRVIQMIVTHSLALDYAEKARLHGIHVALDATDLRNLLHACERAEQKAATLRKEFEGRGLPVIVAGEQANDDDS